jgi:amino acid transporter
VARVLFAMARDGKLPAILAAVHPRFKTPHVSTLLVAAVSLLVGLLFTDRIDDLSRVVNFGALASFALLHLAVVHHHLLRRRTGAWLQHLLFPLAGFTVILFVLYGMDRTAKILGGCWIAAGMLYYLILAHWHGSTTPQL